MHITEGILNGNSAVKKVPIQFIPAKEYAVFSVQELQGTHTVLFNLIDFEFSAFQIDHVAVFQKHHGIIVWKLYSGKVCERTAAFAVRSAPAINAITTNGILGRVMDSPATV